MRVEASKPRRDDRDDRRDERRGRDDYDRRDSRDDRGYGASRPERRERPVARINDKLVRVIVDDLPEGSSWQDLKDFIRTNGGEVKFTEIKNGKGVAGFETKEDAEKAIERLNNTVMRNRDKKEATVTLTLDAVVPAAETPEVPMDVERSRSRSRGSPRYD